MKDDRYTVEDPPEEGECVYIAGPCGGHPMCMEHIYFASTDDYLVSSNALHRTEESAEAHARRMLMVDDMLEALEMLLRAQDSESPTWRNYVTGIARAVAAKARGEVEE
jgi:hypothetical protein